ncbi:hypothetical protein AB5N19_14511 [Seiridium cardinale]|uniref:Uncharacterized protein n=1 Tax=Seiridium cardinale TaxID=138064 RepID=A0ABR2XQZ1_9PEZI
MSPMDKDVYLKKLKSFGGLESNESLLEMSPQDDIAPTVELNSSSKFQYGYAEKSRWKRSARTLHESRAAGLCQNSRRRLDDDENDDENENDKAKPIKW